MCILRRITHKLSKARIRRALCYVYVRSDVSPVNNSDSRMNYILIIYLFFILFFLFYRCVNSDESLTN